MPRLPGYDRQIAPQVAPAQRMDPQQAGFGGAALQQIGAIGAAFGERLREARMKTQSSEAWLGAMKSAADIEERAQKDWRSGVNLYDSEMERVKTGYLSQLDDDEAKADFEQRFELMRLSRRASVKDAAFRGERDHNLANLATLQQDSINQYSSAGNDVTRQMVRDGYAEHVQNMVGAGWIGELEGVKLVQEFKRNGDELMAMRMVDANPAAAIKALDGGQFENIDPERRFRMKEAAEAKIERLQREAEARQNAARSDYADKLSDHIFRLANGIEVTPDAEAAFSSERVAQMFGQDRAKAVIERMDIARRTGRIQEQVAYASPDELADLLQRAGDARATAEDPKAAQGEYEMVLKAIQARNAALEKDPAGFVSRSAPVREALSDYAAAVEGGDSTQIQAATERAVSASIAEQKRLGVPDAAVQPLPQALVDDVTAKMSAASGEDLGDMVKGLSAQYGRYWPDVLRQVGTKANPAAVALALMPDGDGANLLAEASRMKREDLTRGLDSTEVGTIETQVFSADQMRQLRMSLGLTSGGAETYAQMARAVETLALARMQRGASASEAVSASVLDVTGNLRFGEVNSLPFRVPASEDAETIEDGAAALLDGFNLSVDLPPGAEQGMNDEQYREMIRYGGRFVTDPRARGLVLIDPSGAPVTLNGVPIVYSWEDLKSAAGGSAVIPDAASRK